MNFTTQQHRLVGYKFKYYQYKDLIDQKIKAILLHNKYSENYNWSDLISWNTQSVNLYEWNNIHFDKS